MVLQYYLLPFFLFFPILINKLAGSFPKVRLSSFLFFVPVAILILSLMSYFSKQVIELYFWESTYFRLGLRLDVLSGLIATTVSTIGIVVTRFSVRYLEDDPNQIRYFKNLSFCLSFVFLMLMSSNLILFFLSWIGVSYFLHHLLTHFSNREGAHRAAKQKFWVSRIGDTFIILAGFLFVVVFNSLEFSTIFEAIENPIFLEKNYFLINVCSVFLVLGAMTKSAQFPFHYWLPNTMETPTPVSAIMHAGIINAGGYLVVRMSPFLTSSPLALSFLAFIGALTAFWGMLIMFTQTNIKRSLAYSTIAQMGFMMLQCGLGAFSVAVIHLIGHAFYKAYVFLSSSTVTDFARLNRYFPRTTQKQNLWLSLSIAAFSITVVLGVCSFFGHDVIKDGGASILLVILSLALSQVILVSNNKFKSLLTAAQIALLYLALSKGMAFLLTGIVAQNSFGGSFLEVLVLGVSIIVFVGLYLIQNNLQKISETQIGKFIYVKALKGSIL